MISLSQPDDDIISLIKKIHADSPLNIVVDYLWGHSAELIFSCLQGKGSFTAKTRYVSVGSITGDQIQLSAATLRSSDIQLSGSGLGSWSRDEVKKLFSEILPQMFQLAAEGRLRVETVRVNLKDIAELWNLEVPDGRRLVVTI